MAPKVTMTVEEYLEIVSSIGEGAGKVKRGVKGIRKALKPRKGKKDPKMARALRKANAMGRKKNGGLKKGWTQGKIMKKAHALKKRMR